MSHTFKDHGAVFIYTPGMVGPVSIRVGESELEVPAEALLSFVAHHVRSERISRLESMPATELLGLPGGTAKSPNSKRSPVLDMACRLYNTVNWLRAEQKAPFGDIIENNLNTLVGEAEELIKNCGLNPEDV